MARAIISGVDWLKKIEANFTELYQASLTVLASDAEAQAKTAVDKAITPKNLAALTASATFAGLAEQATDAEALAGSDAVRTLTPANLASVLGYTDVLSFAGKNGVGACTLVGVKVGDIVRSVTGIAVGTVGDQSAKFEATITVADQIQQSNATDLSANIYLAYIQRKS